jgi:hypothetical protein
VADKDVIQEGMNKARGKIENTLSYLQKSVPKQESPRRLSRREQLDRFLGMRSDELSELRGKYGDREFRRYVNTMRQYARRL